VAADDEDAGVVVADDTGAPDGGGVAPHHLRVVPAHLPLRVRVGVVVVVLLLVDPRPHGVRRRPVAAGGAPEDARRTARRSAPARSRPAAAPRSSARTRRRCCPMSVSCLACFTTFMNEVEILDTYIYLRRRDYVRLSNHASLSLNENLTAHIVFFVISLGLCKILVVFR
jgi:hypothetical protein